MSTKKVSVTVKGITKVARMLKEHKLAEKRRLKKEAAEYRQRSIEMRNRRAIKLIDEVIFHDPHTTIKRTDGIKVTVTAMEGDKFDKTIGFYACLAKMVFGDHNVYKKLIDNATVIAPKYLKIARGKEREERKAARKATSEARAEKAKERELDRERVRRPELFNPTPVKADVKNS